MKCKDLEKHKLPDKNKKINVGIGFVTGRKNFKNVLKSYLDTWNQSTHLDAEKYALHLFIAYDLEYRGTEVADYKMTEKELRGTIKETHYLGGLDIVNVVEELVKENIVNQAEAKLIFGEGYAMKRNAVLYFALKKGMEHLIFLDDDEYPIANICIDESIAWKGQDVLSTHIQNIQHCDMTHGHHCGYISPVPQMTFDESFSENDFRKFIEAISNDIITWESVKAKIARGGISFAEMDIINNMEVEEVKGIRGMKFISGANLGLNLKDLSKIFPFYNPPGARGEDTFLSTCIGESTIRKVPCYTFHDAYTSYPCLISGVLPNELKAMKGSTKSTYKRFLKACIGWIRYKPLLLYITKKEEYSIEIQEMRKNLILVIPKLCSYFQNEDFAIILKELDFYDAQVEKHFRDFEDTKNVWLKVMASLK